MGSIEATIKAELATVVKGARERITKWVDKNYGGNDFNPVSFVLPTSLGTQRIFAPALQQASELGSTTARGEVPVTRKYAKNTRPTQLPGETTKRALKYLKQKANVVSDKFDQKIQDAVRFALLTGLKTGDSNKEVMKRINDALDVIDDTYAENVVRTNITEAVNLGRLAEFRDPELALFISAVQYSAILDNRTTGVCEFLNGKLFHVGDSALDELSPPNHYQCRSILVPVMIDEKPNEEDFITEAEKGKARELAGEGFV
jgi:SPP1 gp7 family putative phage head morphogenesis protein